MKHHTHSFIVISIVIVGSLLVLIAFFFLQKDMALEAQIEERSEQVEEKKEEQVKSSVPLDELIGGGPPKDGIPSIDDPVFGSVEDAEEYLSDEEPGISISIDGTSRFYPYQILVWHEIVNDTINGERILVTYCPLCGSGIVFDPVVDGERVEFGVSGKLWNSNLVMYDRKTDSYWSQALGEAIVGQMTGTQLEILPYNLTTFGLWKEVFPKGEVLTRDTGAIRFYGNDPYGDYYTNDKVLFPVNNTDSRLDSKELILGVVIDDKPKAYVPKDIKKEGTAIDSIGDTILTLKYNESLDAVEIYKKTADDEIRVNPFSTFWFSWVAIHPQSEIYKPN